MWMYFPLCIVNSYGLLSCGKKTRVRHMLKTHRQFWRKLGWAVGLTLTLAERFVVGHRCKTSGCKRLQELTSKIPFASFRKSWLKKKQNQTATHMWPWPYQRDNINSRSKHPWRMWPFARAHLFLRTVTCTQKYFSQIGADFWLSVPLWAEFQTFWDGKANQLRSSWKYIHRALHATWKP